MKFQVIIFLAVIINSLLIAQDRRYTKGAENGYVWITLNQSYNPLTDYKFEYLASMLENQRYMIKYENKPKMPIGCRDDIAKVGESENAEELDLNYMVEMIDEFYTRKENLVIPIIGAYCYCIKDLSGLTREDLENYRQELLDFSKQ
ncbi:MAG: hypothetical protein MUF28_13530 [Ignavibacterium sp.]|jgi:hypothetical protein|nr:hypothetical protein [Ignavibacterium sp.]